MVLNFLACNLDTSLDTCSSMRCCDEVQIRFTLLRACGLQSAANNSAGGGIDTYATITTEFLPESVSIYGDVFFRC